jgi:cytochrome b subunit of formate dehydrogenase
MAYTSRFPCSNLVQSPATVMLRLAVTIIIVMAASLTAAAQECADCHDVELPSHAAHAEVACVSCHTGAEEFPHEDGMEPRSCESCHSGEANRFSLGVHGLALIDGNPMAPDCVFCHEPAHEVERPGTTPFRRATVELCGACHSEIVDEFHDSVHFAALQAGNREAPNCVTCHGEHDTNHVGGTSAIRETCAQCHGDVELARRFGLPENRLVSFDQSFHGLALRGGSQRVANCASCHGIHQILPSRDPRSMVHADNLPETCGSCHPGAGRRFSLGPVHILEGDQQLPIADLIRLIYLILIPLTLGAMIAHNVGDWIRKVRTHTRYPERRVVHRLEMRMYPMERLQHALLAISFIILTWTGFALKFPESWWAWPLVAVGPEFRGWTHRVAAVVFIITMVLHVTLLITHKRLRDHWLELRPMARDLREGVLNFAYNLGLRKTPPRLSSHSYIEKVEYWAVVWGAVIMTATGIILWYANFFLAWLPKWVFDVATVIHYYEAILAAAAIVVWHFYSSIFDPSVYPINTAFMTGKGPARDAEEDESHSEPAATADPERIEQAESEKPPESDG